MTPLPIDSLLPEVSASLESQPNLVIVAAPGAGKTTRVPIALLRSPWLKGECLMLQPRRIAARASAARIAEENGWKLGEEVGYQVRFENRTSARTRLRVVTEGILTRLLQSNPSLEGIGAVILDEFHERSLHTDLAVALLRELQQGLREDLRIVVMSATLDAKGVSRFLGDCPVLESAGRKFPVEILHRPRAGIWSELRGLDLDVKESVRALVDHPQDDGGHVLVFLPGVGEIRRCEATLRPLADAKGATVLTLHGSLSGDEQDRVLRPTRERKFILATNIAETSLTIDGVTSVVDSGLARLLRCDPKFGIERLELTRISSSSSVQRAGRAGRQSPGRAVRLWSKIEDGQLRAQEIPEIQRLDLASTCLMLADWGVRDPSGFAWFEAPPVALLESARALLLRLELIDDKGALTPLGREVLRLPLPPRLGRALVGAVDARDDTILRAAATAAALLQERDLLLKNERGLPFTAHVGESDLELRTVALGEAERRRFDRSLRDDGIDAAAARAVASARDQYLNLARRIAPARERTAHSLEEVLLLGYPDRLTRRRAPGDARGVMVGGRGVVLDPTSVVREAELFLSFELQESRRDGKLEARVTQAVGVTRESLEHVFPGRVVDRTEHFWDEGRGGVQATRAIFFGDLALTDPAPVPVNPKDAAELSARALGRDPRAFFARHGDASDWLRRAEFFRKWMPEAEFPEFDEARLRETLEAAFQEKPSLNAVLALPLAERLAQTLSYPQKKSLDTEAPEFLTVPSGSRIRLSYDERGGVALPVRLQEIFGWTATPRLALGRVPVTLELLGPNFRPVQITNDLTSFWSRGYPEVRKELRARYPKHSWPDDPLTARPEAKGRRRGP